MRTTIASHRLSPREQRQRETTLRLRALLDEFHSPLHPKPVPLLDPGWDETDETVIQLN